METFLMSVKEINQIEIMEQLLAKQVKQKHAAKLLGLSIRQVIRKLKTYRRQGASSLIHQSRGKPSHRQIDPSLLARAIKLIKKQYVGFGPTLATEKLAELDGLVVNRETLRLTMIKQGIWKARRQRIHHRSWRPRKECLGEMLQFDGSYHAWFEDRAPQCCLLAFIDDATSKVVWAEFAQSESTLAVMQATQHLLTAHGRPLTIYADRGKVVKVNQNNPDDEFKTQYTRAVNELEIKVIYALSAQAKGRVERLFGTFQDRLIKEMRLVGISSIAEGNEFLVQYLPVYNQRFSVAPKEKTNLFRGVKGCQLDEILSVQHYRQLKNDFTLRYRNQWYQLTKQQATIIRPKNTIKISQHTSGKITMSMRKIALNYVQLIGQPQPIVKMLSKANPSLATSASTKPHPWKPKANHPWKKFIINPCKKQYQST